MMPVWKVWAKIKIVSYETTLYAQFLFRLGIWYDALIFYTVYTDGKSIFSVLFEKYGAFSCKTAIKKNSTFCLKYQISTIITNPNYKKRLIKHNKNCGQCNKKKINPNVIYKKHSTTKLSKIFSTRIIVLVVVFVLIPVIRIRHRSQIAYFDFVRNDFWNRKNQ